MSEYGKAVVYESASEWDGMGCRIGENKNYANQTKLIYGIGENKNYANQTKFFMGLVKIRNTQIKLNSLRDW